MMYHRIVRSLATLLTLIVAGLLTPLAQAVTIKLNGPLPAGGNIGTFKISPDSGRVIYRGDGDFDTEVDLYSRPIDGSGSEVVLNSPRPLGGDIVVFDISADSSRVVYVGDGDTDGVFELYSRPIDGSGSEVTLNSSLPSGGNVANYLIAPDSSRVVWRADGDTNEVSELYSRPIDGSGSQAKLNMTLTGSKDIRNEFQITPDSSRVVWLADGLGDEIDELFSRPIDGSGTQVKLNNTPTSGGDVVDGFQITADSRVVFRTDMNTDERFELYSRPADGSEHQRRLNDPLPTQGDVYDFEIAGSEVVYRANGDHNSNSELYRRPADALGLEVKLHETLPPPDAFEELDITEFKISPDGSRVVYRRRADSDFLGITTESLIGRSVATDDAVTLCNACDQSGFTGGNVNLLDYQISPTSDYLVYHQRTDVGVTSLVSIPLDGSGAPETLNESISGAAEIDGYTISPDGQFVVYSIDNDGDGNNDVLMGATIDGSTAPFQISDTLIAGGRLSDFQVSPDGSRVVYSADRDTLGVIELYSTALLDPFTSEEIASGGPASGDTGGGSSEIGGIDFGFDDVTGGGDFTATFDTPATIDDLDEFVSAQAASTATFTLPGEPLQVWNIDFDGTFTGIATLEFGYDDANLLPQYQGAGESALRIFHYDEGLNDWVALDPLFPVDTINNIITVQTDSFSPFMLGGVPEPSTYVMAVFGLCGLTLVARRRKRA